MTFTYTLDDDIGKVRFELGDTSEPAFFSDEEITLKLTEHSSDIMLTCAALCHVMATRLGGAMDFSSDDQSFKRSQARQGWTDRAAAFEARAQAILGDVGTFEVNRTDPTPDSELEAGRRPYPMPEAIE